ncbi:MAG TPA: PP2C family serine/threonine-protein phosphatase [Pirellulales bacterium]|jgi:protein phosphatase|nr:PP2C family serine/threonine-protein phosphatase [Pirellulales bacterium]
MTATAEPDGQPCNALEHAALTDVGLRRANNQDTFAVALAPDEAELGHRGHLFMVADGMGAHAAGELASKLACESVPHTYRKLLDGSPADALRQAVIAANANIHERGQANAEFQGMGTTCCVLVVVGGAAIVAHVGDSRVYRLRGETLDQLTFDHSLVWEMTAVGQMPRGEVASFIPKNIITRSLGPHAAVQVDLEGPYWLEPGDTFLLCSDGLSGQLKDEEIGVVLLALPPSEAVHALVDLANLRGGPDNITAVVVRVVSVCPTTNPSSLTDSVAEQSNPATHPVLWGITALCLLFALSFVITGKLLAALVSGLAAAATAIAALVANLLKSSPAPSHSLAGPLGTGPHTTHQCTANAERVTSLAQMAEQLRDAAKDEHWMLDWAKFNAYCDQAQSALARADFRSAVRDYAEAIVFMMDQIRHRSKGKDGGSVREN